MCTDKVAAIQTIVFALLYVVFFTCYEVGNALFFEAYYEIDPEAQNAMWLGFVPGTPWQWQTGGPFIAVIVLIGNWIAKCTKNKTLLVCWGFFNLNAAFLLLILTYAYSFFYPSSCPIPLEGEEPIPCDKNIVHYWNTTVVGGIGMIILHVWMCIDLHFWICCMTPSGYGGYYFGEEGRPLMPPMGVPEYVRRHSLSTADDRGYSRPPSRSQSRRPQHPPSQHQPPQYQPPQYQPPQYQPPQYQPPQYQPPPQQQYDFDEEEDSYRR
eukprot:TRINITY_DN5294_c0_g1_i4.p2 TRINITY_DN5294_c0_g1~~TRINITY_DN5294_c0_g1_i4.p2  ORF type:complete len:267 (-),score=44.08 TRINITY_DN5294_c0_g1_i4:1645-2445(-)